jgi:hypothetical protein
MGRFQNGAIPRSLAKDAKSAKAQDARRNKMLKPIVDNDRKKTMFRCEQCGWESDWKPSHEAFEPHHECKPKPAKPVFV